jgi:hypothetical protein
MRMADSFPARRQHVKDLFVAAGVLAHLPCVVEPDPRTMVAADHSDEGALESPSEAHQNRC